MSFLLFFRRKANILKSRVCLRGVEMLWVVPLPADSFSKTKMISAEDESIDSKYTVFNCVKSNYAHFIRNYLSLIFVKK